MLSERGLEKLREKVAQSDHPRELAVDVMYTVQKHYGYMSDEALQEAAQILGMTPLEVEELATFYDFIYREPVGKYVIRICDSTICTIQGYQSVVDYLCKRLNISLGGTTKDGMFTLLPACCIGYCDHAPAMLINGKLYGPLTPEFMDRVLEELREQQVPLKEAR
jgi:NADH-quinone oxidoreductase subunit E